MSNYYNENDEKAADWLESLIKRQLIPAGDVDRRSIEDVLPDDLRKYTQCHFFAGIGGWSRALELAGWPEDNPIWTGSCPCQPFSAAGKGKGVTDERHLWPAFHWLIQQCRPKFVFGEQVAGKAGESWFDVVSNDLAHQDYTSGFAVLAACSIGAPHIRKRLYWVAHSDSKPTWGDSGGIHSKEGKCEGTRRENGGESNRLGNDCKNVGLADANSARLQGWGKRGNSANKLFTWEGSLAQCRDGKARPFKPGVLPMANGVSGRVELIKGYGNAIVPQVAAEFVMSAVN